MTALQGAVFIGMKPQQHASLVAASRRELLLLLCDDYQQKQKLEAGRRSHVGLLILLAIASRIGPAHSQVADVVAG